jgi:serine/threonine-protein kinase
LKLPPGASNPTPLPFTDLKQPTGVAVDAGGNLYITDFGSNRVLKLSPGASSPFILPFTGLDHPADVAVDPHGNVYVFDDLNFRVLKLPAR